MRMYLMPLVLLPLASCGPIPVAEAESICYNDARMATGPHGAIGFGVDSNGNTSTGLSIGISSDYLLGRDPDQVYANCVFNRSGQMPTRPFSSLPPLYR